MLLIVIIIGVGLIARAWLVFDNLLRHQYKLHRASWEQDGAPIGFFFVPDGAKNWKHFFMGEPGGPRLDNKRAGARIQHRWLMDTPEWAKTDSRALELLFWYRALTLAGLGIIAVSGVSYGAYYWFGFG